MRALLGSADGARSWPRAVAAAGTTELRAYYETRSGERGATSRAEYTLKLVRRFQLLGVGPVAQCSVGRDANGDGRAAGGKGSGGREPTGVTDAAGKFELATLDAPSPEGAAVLANGAEEALPCTDVATGLPAALPLLACDGSAVVSPLTSLAAAVMRASGRRDSAQALDCASAQRRTADALGLGSGARPVLGAWDYWHALSESGASEAKEALRALAAAVVLTSTGVVIGAVADAACDGDGDGGVDWHHAGAGAVYGALAEGIVSGWDGEQPLPSGGAAALGGAHAAEAIAAAALRGCVDPAIVTTLGRSCSQLAALAGGLEPAAESRLLAVSRLAMGRVAAAARALGAAGGLGANSAPAVERFELAFDAALCDQMDVQACEAFRLRAPVHAERADDGASERDDLGVIAAPPPRRDTLHPVDGAVHVRQDDGGAGAVAGKAAGLGVAGAAVLMIVAVCIARSKRRATWGLRGKLRGALRRYGILSPKRDKTAEGSGLAVSSLSSVKLIEHGGAFSGSASSGGLGRGSKAAGSSSRESSWATAGGRRSRSGRVRDSFDVV